MTSMRTSTTSMRRPGLPHREAMRLATTEYDRVLTQFRSLSAADWTTPTVNTGWDVRALAAHMLGMIEMSAHPSQMIRQARAAERIARQQDRMFIDVLTQRQVEQRCGLDTDELIRRWAAASPRASAMRRRVPALVRRLRAPIGDQPAGPRPDSVSEPWSIGYLNDIINTRDPWLHRGDIALATGRPLHLTADHDGALVDDVVRDWAQRHGQPYQLTLTGPAGGTWSAGQSGAVIEMDAVEFCRVLSGRGDGDCLLRTDVPF